MVRECREELGVVVRVGELIGRAGIDDRLELAVFAAEALRGRPRPGTDHDELRLLTGVELDCLPWLDADLAILPAVKRRLSLAADGD